MPKPGYKACRSCTREIPVACKKCTHCNADLTSCKRSSTLAGVVSPVQERTLTSFRHTSLASSVRPRSNRVQVARPITSRPGIGTDAREESSGSQYHEVDDPPAVNSPGSPVAATRLASAGRDVLSDYTSQLRIGSCRYAIVAENEAGAFCYAVAGLLLGPDGSLSISVGLYN